VIRLGAQGWNYDAWVGPFYPEGTRPADYLRVYARAFDTIEVDATFYAIPPSATIRGWAAKVPPAFQFALKLPQEITHERRLRRAQDVLSEFTDRARELEGRLGPILVQLGPDFGVNGLPALAAFLPTLPPDLKFAVEFRDRAWMHDGVIALLAEHQVALALTDARWIPRRTMLAMADRPTAKFCYVRWMGPDRDLVDYSRIQVDRSREVGMWMPVLTRVAEREEAVYGYVNNHFSGHSPATLRDMQGALGQPVVDPAALGEQLTLF
jgi:uncharacterized protein YecE (DUF72 family)